MVTSGVIAQNLNNTAKKDPTTYKISPPSFEAINDNSYKDFIVNSDSSYLEIIYLGGMISTIPIKLLHYVSIEKFDSVRSEMKSIGINRKRLVIKCYLSNIEFSDKDLIDILMGGRQESSKK